MINISITLIFAASLAVSIVCILDTLEAFINKNKQTSPSLYWIMIILWSLFYYLNKSL